MRFPGYGRPYGIDARSQYARAPPQLQAEIPEAQRGLEVVFKGRPFDAMYSGHDSSDAASPAGYFTRRRASNLNLRRLISRVKSTVEFFRGRRNARRWREIELHRLILGALQTAKQFETKTPGGALR